MDRINYYHESKWTVCRKRVDGLAALDPAPRFSPRHPVEIRCHLYLAIINYYHESKWTVCRKRADGLAALGAAVCVDALREVALKSYG